MEDKQLIAPPVWPRRIIFAVAFTAVVAAHTINMYEFPAYREDEGTYLSQAWSVLKQGSLAPYTYWYDHAPVGWLFLAAWEYFFGQFMTFDLSVDSGRLFMSVLQAAVCYMLYKMAYRTTKRFDVSILAMLLFGLTPLAVVFHRRVLIDNIMVFWLMLSIVLLTKPIRLRSVMASALSFAAAVLTKESAVAFFPVLAFIVARESDKTIRHFSWLGWVGLSGLTISVYPLFALLKGELTPTGSFLGGSAPHVSLVDAFKFQVSRGGLIWDDGVLQSMVQTWSRYGIYFLVVGVLATVVALLRFRRRWQWYVALLSLSYMIFTVRGQVLDWYIIPLFPLLAYSVAALIGDFISWGGKLYPTRFSPIRAGVAYSFVAILILSQLFGSLHIFYLRQTENQIQAVNWAKSNIPANKIFLIDNYAFVDFNSQINKITDTRVHYYWKVDTDPQIKYNVLRNDWNSIDYILFTPAMMRTIALDGLTFVKTAYERSYIVKRFDAHDTLNEGYPVEIREVNNKNSALRQSWEYYKQRFITEDGRVIDPSNQQTTSEGQSYALLRAVWMDDQSTFDTVLNWTNNYLKRSNDSLFAWLAESDQNGKIVIKDHASASDADEDIALALLFAYRQWKTPRYLVEAREIISDIWEKDVVKVGELYVITAGADVQRETGYLVNPSYFSPASYRIFADADEAHPWEELAEDVYVLLDSLNLSGEFAQARSVPLVPNWIFMDKNGGVHSASATFRQADWYGYDAFRLYWRLALDSVWFKERKAVDYLRPVSDFFKSELNKNNKIFATYTLQGDALMNSTDTSTIIGALSALFVTDQEKAIEVFSEQIWPVYNHTGYWGDGGKYYDQNWAWFGTALYSYSLPNLWGNLTFNPTGSS